MRAIITLFTFIAIFVFFISASYAEDQWDFGEPTRASSHTRSSDLSDNDFSLSSIVGSIQRSISNVDGDRCSLYPTCSAFSAEVFNKHGLLIGIMMTAGRLIQETDETEIAPRITVENRIMPYDPVSRNDFWWFKGSVLTENNP